MVDKIITLNEVVARDKQDSVQAWIIWKCEESIKAKKIKQGWDGVSIEGEPVLAFVNNGRWLARCKVCSNPVYVSPTKPILYCPECGNGGSKSAWGVEFPLDREKIEAELLRRPMELADPNRLVRNEIEEAFNSRPVIAGLTRAWRPGITVETLAKENDDALKVQPQEGSTR